MSVVLISYGLYNHGITDHMIKIMGISIRWAHGRESSNSSLLSLFLVSLMLWIEYTTFKLSWNYSNLSQSCCWVGVTYLACYRNSEHLTVHQHFHNCNNPSPSPNCWIFIDKHDATLWNCTYRVVSTIENTNKKIIRKVLVISGFCIHGSWTRWCWNYFLMQPGGSCESIPTEMRAIIQTATWAVYWWQKTWAPREVRISTPDKRTHTLHIAA